MPTEAYDGRSRPSCAPCSCPYEDALEAAEIYGMEVLRRPGAKAHDWFAGVQQVAEHRRSSTSCRCTATPSCSTASRRRCSSANRRVGVHVQGRSTSAARRELEALVARGF